MPPTHFTLRASLEGVKGLRVTSKTLKSTRSPSQARLLGGRSESAAEKASVPK